MNTIQKIQNGQYKLDGFTQEEKDFNMALIKMSYNDGYEEGKAEITNKVSRALIVD